MDNQEPVVLDIAERAKMWGVSRKVYRGVVQQTLSQRIRSVTQEGGSIVEMLQEIMEKGEDRDRIKAAELMLDRGWGRAVTPVVNLNDAAASVAGRYGIDPGELAAVAQSLWNAQSGHQGELVEVFPEADVIEEESVPADSD